MLFFGIPIRLSSSNGLPLHICRSTRPLIFHKRYFHRLHSHGRRRLSQDAQLDNSLYTVMYGADSPTWSVLCTQRSTLRTPSRQVVQQRPCLTDRFRHSPRAARRMHQGGRGPSIFERLDTLCNDWISILGWRTVMVFTVYRLAIMMSLNNISVFRLRRRQCGR